MERSGHNFKKWDLLTQLVLREGDLVMDAVHLYRCRRCLMIVNDVGLHSSDATPCRGGRISNGHDHGTVPDAWIH